MSQELLDLPRQATLAERLIHRGVKALELVAEKLDDIAQQIAELKDAIDSKGSD